MNGWICAAALQPNRTARWRFRPPHFTFAQTLSESAKLATRRCLVVSIPSSQNEMGARADSRTLEALKNRHRALGDLMAPGERRGRLRDRPGGGCSSRSPIRAVHGGDAVVKAFRDEYRKFAQEFPLRKRANPSTNAMKAAYPSTRNCSTGCTRLVTLDKFQRTRGVLAP